MNNTAMILNVYYTIKPGMRVEFINKAYEYRIPAQSRAESGNLKYEYFLPVESEDLVLLIEIWKDKAAFEAHKTTEHFKLLSKLKEAYVLDTKLEIYNVQL